MSEIAKKDIEGKISYYENEIFFMRKLWVKKLRNFLFVFDCTKDGKLYYSNNYHPSESPYASFDYDFDLTNFISKNRKENPEVFDNVDICSLILELTREKREIQTVEEHLKFWREHASRIQ